MKILPFKPSEVATIGVELEYQIINPDSFGLVSRARELMRKIKESPYEPTIKPEVTQSMIEVNSSVHHTPQELMAELNDIHNFLLTQGEKLNILFCGGGTHPFQKWSKQKIYPSVRYKKLARIYRFLSQRSTVFGLHIHVGCANGEDALYLTHALARYVPQFIAFCASSPFYQGADTGFCSSRFTSFNAFPSSGTIPYLINYDEFSDYFYKLRELGLIETMKDIYWDIRPKPELGTVEIRVCDCPLTIKKAVIMTAYIQALSLYLLEEKPDKICHDLYYLYGYNRFQASRYGFAGEFINPYTSQRCLISEDILETIERMEWYVNQLKNMIYISKLMEDVINNRIDADFLKQVFKETDSLAKVVAEQCRIWSQEAEL